ncbi:MAG: hypothetical protein DRG30_05740 [Epsilonproteobacteria bacterium]|nr:MAG: hypothetical protein DRG30_05740 [Campylobacterota bacterium]
MKIFIENTILKSIFFILFFVFVQQLNATAGRNDIKLQKASEDIKFISQQLVKDYFYLYLNPQQKEIKDHLSKELLQLDSKLRIIATSTKRDSTKKILTFLAYSRKEITKSISKPYTSENSTIVLDYSEILLEGAGKISKEHSYTFSEEEAMLINAKNMAYMLERINKYYMMLLSGFNDSNNIKQLEHAIASFDMLLEKVNNYTYRGDISIEVNEINSYWKVVRGYYLSLEESKLSNILYISADYLEDLISKLELYHNKSL